jgi:hypothetical protein
MTGLIWLRIESRGRTLRTCNDPSRCTKVGEEYLDWLRTSFPGVSYTLIMNGKLGREFKKTAVAM